MTQSDIPVCKRKWRVRCASCVNCLPQNWHVYGFSPVCNCTCDTKLLNDAHFLPHSQHSASFPECLWTCTRSSALVRHVLEQSINNFQLIIRFSLNKINLLINSLRSQIKFDGVLYLCLMYFRLVFFFGTVCTIGKSSSISKSKSISSSSSSSSSTPSISSPIASHKSSHLFSLSVCI